MITKIGKDVKDLLSADNKTDVFNMGMASGAAGAAMQYSNAFSDKVNKLLDTESVSEELRRKPDTVERLQKLFNKKKVPIINAPFGEAHGASFIHPNNFNDKKFLEQLTDLQGDFIANGKKNGAILVSPKASLDVIVHEFGHSTGPYNNPLFRGLLRASQKSVMYAPMLSAAGTYLRAKEDGSEDSSKVLPTALQATGMALPTVQLAEEARGSLVGLHKIKPELSKGALREARGRLGKMFATYAVGSVLPQVASNGVAYLLGKNRDKVKKYVIKE